jgi:hypothetical protein
MPWDISPETNALRVNIRAPMLTEWEALLDEINVRLGSAKLPVALPSSLPGSSNTDALMLKLLAVTLAATGIVVISPI